MPTVNQNIELDIVRPLIASRWQRHLVEGDGASHLDRLTALCNYVEVKGSVDLTEEEVKRIIYMVDIIRLHGRWLDDCVAGEQIVLPNATFDHDVEDIWPHAPIFIGSNMVARYRAYVVAQSMMINGFRRGDDGGAA